MPTPRYAPTHGVRVADELWLPAREIAAERGETITAVIVRALDLYVRSNGWNVDPVTALERLARLHRAGDITAAEFHRAKVDLLARL